MGFDRRSLMKGGLAGAVMALGGSLVKISNSTALVPIDVPKEWYDLVPSSNEDVPIRLPVANLKRIELRRDVIETGEVNGLQTFAPGRKWCDIEAYGLYRLDIATIMNRVVQIHIGQEAFSLRGGVITGRLYSVQHNAPIDDMVTTELTLVDPEFTWLADDPIVATIINIEIDGKKLATGLLRSAPRRLKG